MITAIISDIHGNLPALNALLHMTKDKVDTYVCLGDVVNYGPWNDECLEIICSLPGIVLLEGNHERLFTGQDKIDEELPIVQDFFDNSIKNFTRYDLIENLPKSYNLGVFTCSHTINNLRIYKDTNIGISLDRNYFIGHTHHQFRITHSNMEIVNCGSVGQNRGNINKINYALYDTESTAITLCEEPYSIDFFLKKIKEQNYPQNCIEYYSNKLKSQLSP